MENTQKTTEVVGQNTSEKKTSIVQQLKHKYWVMLLATILASCGTDPTEDIDTAPTTVTNLQKNGTSITVSNVTKDADGDATSTRIDIKKNGTTVFTENFDDNNFSKTYNNLDPATYVVETLATANGKEAKDTDSIEIDPPNILDVAVRVDKENIDERVNIKDMVFATLDNVNNTAGINYEITQGGEYFKLVDNKIVGLDTEFDYETLQKITVEIKASASGQADVVKTFEVDINDTNEAQEHVDMADVTYTREFLGGTVTEDLSYTSTNSADGVSVEIAIDEKDSDPNNPNIIKYLLSGYDANNQPVYTDKKSEKIAEILAKSQGDATQLNIANTYENGGYGISGFTRTTVTEDGTTGATVINQHGEIVSKSGYRKGIQAMIDYLDIADQGFGTAPNQAPNTGNNTVENWRLARAFVVEFGKKMQQTGATDKNTVAGWAAEAMARVIHMTDAERRDLMLTVASQTFVETYWD